MALDKHRKTVLITGASKGLGKSLAFEFALRNFNVILCARDTDLLQQNCASINECGGNSCFIQCDVTNPADMDRAVEFTVNTFGQIDIAVLNAGVGKSVRFSNFDHEAFDTVIATNLNGVVNGLTSLVPVMKSQGSGKIVGISSINDGRPIPGNSAYVASKSALTVILEAAAMELKPLGISVITVRPGFLETEMISQNKSSMPFLMSSEKAAKIIVDGILKNRSKISFPMPMVLLSSLTRLIPARIWRYIFRVRIPQ